MAAVLCRVWWDERRATAIALAGTIVSAAVLEPPVRTTLRSGAWAGRPCHVRSQIRESQMPTEFSILRRIQFSETDMAGIVHFANFFRMMAEVEHAFLRTVGLRVSMQYD